MELTQFINGKRIIIRRCNPIPSNRVAVISHGRFVPLKILFSSMTMNAHVPAGVTVNWYVRDGETITNHKVIALYEQLQRNQLPVPVKDYSDRNTVKNYLLRADMSVAGACTARPSGYCDIIFPLETITTQDILNAIASNDLPYHEIHFLSCRAKRLTLEGI